MSRRTFIKQSGLLAGAMFLEHNFTNAMPGNPEKIRLGIIGFGDRGAGIRGVILQLPELFELTTVCDVLDIRLERAKKYTGKQSVNIVKDYREVLSDKNIDAVIIATTLSEHFSIAKAALEAGKHVYLEKTMTYNKEQALELLSLVVKKHPRQIFQVGHQYRSSPLYYKVKEIIQGGELGHVTQIDCRWDRNGNWRRPVPSPELERSINWRMYKEYSGGLAAELLSHQIDFINWVFDTHPDEIYATGGIDFFKDGRETFDNLQAVLRYNKEGMIGNFGATCANQKDGYLFKIKGSEGSVTLLMNEGFFYPEKKNKPLQTVDGVTGSTKIVLNKDGGMPILPEPTKDGTWYALKDFHTCITEGKMPESNIYTGTKTSVCVDLINQSSYTSTIQKWKPEYNVG